jgi:hypothetical protein
MPGFFLPEPPTMSLLNVIKHFDSVRELPIEIPEIRDVVLTMGFQDSIVFVPCQKMDPAKLRGAFYQYTTHPGVYASPQFRTLIVYSAKLAKDWQRLVCAKELIHVLDGKAEKTKTEDELQGLIDKLIGPLSTEDFGLADIMAAKDKLALYQALAVLFPDAARTDALAQIKAGKTVEDISEQASIPPRFVQLVLKEEWPSLRSDICAI